MFRSEKEDETVKATLALSSAELNICVNNILYSLFHQLSFMFIYPSARALLASIISLEMPFTHSRVRDAQLSTFGWFLMIMVGRKLWLIGCARCHAGAELKGLSMRCVTFPILSQVLFASGSKEALPTQSPKKNTFRVTNYDPLAIIRVVEILNYSRFTFAYTERDAWGRFFDPNTNLTKTTEKMKQKFDRKEIYIIAGNKSFSSISHQLLIISYCISKSFRHN